MKNFNIILQDLLKWIYRIMIVVILIVIIFFYKLSNFIVAQDFLIPVPLCILIAIILISLLTILFIKHKIHTTYIRSFFAQYSGRLILLATLLLLAVQLFVSWNSYFLSGWDVQVLLDNAYKISNNTVDTLNSSYFSRYPNNLLIEYLFVQIFNFAKFFGITSFNNGVFIIISLQCILSCLSGLLVFKTLSNITHSPLVSWIGWILYVLLIGTSPWVMIPYSDSISLIFPILIIYLWSTIGNEKYVIFKWTAIAAISYLGYKLKPQTIITFIAIVIIQLIFTNFSKAKIFSFIKCLIPMVVSVVLLNFTVSCLCSSLPFNLDKNLELGMPHFLMQGLNEETQGMFSRDDQNFSLEFSTTEERISGNFKESARRVKSLGFFGIAKLAAIKTSSNYANGVFGWSQEGGQLFYAHTFKDKSVISPILKETLYMGGAYYKIFAITKQILWFAALALSAFSLYGKTSASMKTLLTVALSIIGITIFDTIFEARARYLYSYVPLYIVLAAVGWQNLTHKIKNKIK